MKIAGIGPNRRGELGGWPSAQIHARKIRAVPDPVPVWCQSGAAEAQCRPDSVRVAATRGAEWDMLRGFSPLDRSMTSSSSTSPSSASQSSALACAIERHGAAPGTEDAPAHEAEPDGHRVNGGKVEGGSVEG